MDIRFEPTAHTILKSSCPIPQIIRSHLTVLIKGVCWKGWYCEIMVVSKELTRLGDRPAKENKGKSE